MFTAFKQYPCSSGLLHTLAHCRGSLHWKKYVEEPSQISPKPRSTSWHTDCPSAVTHSALGTHGMSSQRSPNLANPLGPGWRSFTQYWRPCCVSLKHARPSAHWRREDAPGSPEQSPPSLDTGYTQYPG